MQVRTSATLLGVAAAIVSLSLSAEIPRTDDGKPDFSGTYDISRPDAHGPRPGPGRAADLHTVEEIEELKRLAHSRVDEAAAPSDPDREGLKALEGQARERGVDSSGTYTPGSHDWFWFDCGGQYCDYFQVDGEYRTSIIIDPPNGRRPAISDAGRERRAGLRPYYKSKYPGEAWWLAEGGDPYDNPENMSIGDRCIYMSLTVPASPSAYNNMKTIVQTDNEVLIMVEWMHWPRVIRLDSEHLPDDMVSYGGDPIGWWEGDTLNVETTNFRDFMSPHDARPGLKIVERFSPSTVTAFSTASPYTTPTTRRPTPASFRGTRSDKRLYEYACHEGNYSMTNTLRGARVLEAKWIEEHGEPAPGDTP